MNHKNLASVIISEELKRFDSLYKSVRSDNPRLQEMIEHMYKVDGKKIRPSLLLLTAKTLGEVNDCSYHAAVTIELLHMASLIHDDVVDEADMRRGQASLNSIYDNKKTVLCGDFILSSALTQSVLTNNIEIITRIAKLGKNLSEGELIQLLLVQDVVIDENEYYNVIRKKTASLFSECMRIGALSVGADKDIVEKLAELGEFIGIGIQLRDDIFDYYDDNIGKPTGNDIREGKITLPLLYAIDNANEKEYREVMSIIKSKNFTDKNIKLLINFAKEKGGIKYTYDALDAVIDKAKQIVFNAEFISADMQEAFLGIIQYLKERKY